MGASDQPSQRYLHLEAVNPVDGKLFEVRVSYAQVQAIARKSMVRAVECGKIVPQILRKPARIFEGIRWDEDEDKGFRTACGGRCYSGVPGNAYRADGTPRPSYPNQVFLVFVNTENVVYLWCWAEADPADSGSPMDWAERFKAKLI